MLVSITIFSISKSSLKKFFLRLNKVCLNKKLKIKYLPHTLNKTNIKNILTVLKSPHVNKIAQEHYKHVVFKKRVGLYTRSTFKLLAVLKKLGFSTLADLAFKIELIINRVPLTKKLKTILNPDSIMLKNSSGHDKKHSLIDNYLRISDIYGEITGALDEISVYSRLNLRMPSLPKVFLCKKVSASHFMWSPSEVFSKILSDFVIITKNPTVKKVSSVSLETPRNKRLLEDKNEQILSFSQETPKVNKLLASKNDILPSWGTQALPPMNSILQESLTKDKINGEEFKPAPWKGNKSNLGYIFFRLRKYGSNFARFSENQLLSLSKELVEITDSFNEITKKRINKKKNKKSILVLIKKIDSSSNRLKKRQKFIKQQKIKKAISACILAIKKILSEIRSRIDPQ